MSRRRQYGLSQTPEPTNRSKWPSLHTFPTPRSEPANMRNRKIVFKDDDGDSVGSNLPAKGNREADDRSQRLREALRELGSTKCLPAKRESDSRRNKYISEENDSNHDAAIVSATNVKLLKSTVRDLSQKKGINVAGIVPVSKAHRNVTSGQKGLPGSITSISIRSEEQDSESNSSTGAESQHTPGPSSRTGSSLDKLKVATALSEQAKEQNRPLSHTDNVFNARNSSTKSTIVECPTFPNSRTSPLSTLDMSSPATALIDAADNLRRWLPCKGNDITFTPTTTSVRTHRNHVEKDHLSQSVETTLIEASVPAVHTHFPKIRRLEAAKQITGSERQVVLNRISDIYGSGIAQQRLVVQPYQTFSTTVFVESASDDSDDEESSGDDRKVDRKKLGKHVQSVLTPVANVKMSTMDMKRQSHKVLDSVLAEARKQAQRLQKLEVQKRLKIEQTKSCKNDKKGKEQSSILSGVIDNRVKASNPQAKKMRHSESATVATTMDEVSNESVDDSPRTHLSKKRTREKDVEDQSVTTVKKRKHGLGKDVRKECIFPMSNTSCLMHNSSRSPKLATSSNSSTYNDHITDQLKGLRDLIPVDKLVVAAACLNRAEDARISTILAKKKKSEEKKIRKGKLDTQDAVWQGVDVLTAREQNMLCTAQLLSETDDRVLIKAAVDMIHDLMMHRDQPT